jgi:hypothetical protein
LTEDELVELVRVREVAQGRQRRAAARYREQWVTSRRQIALQLLQERGRPQQAVDYIPDAVFDQLHQQIAQLQTQLQRLEQPYLPPEGTIVHRYWVNRRYARYAYNKLMALRPVFPAVEQHKRQWTRVIHLSKDDDLRNLEARKGITRQQRLLSIREALEQAQAALQAALELTEQPVEPYWSASWEDVEAETTLADADATEAATPQTLAE